MKAEKLLPLFIAAHVAAIALVVDGLGIDQQESGRLDGVSQVVDWNPRAECMAWSADDEIARYRSDADRQPNSKRPDERDCVNFHGKATFLY